MDKLTAEFPKLNRIPRLHHVHGNPVHPVFLQFQVHQGQRQFRSVDVRRRLFQDIGRRADVVFMSVGKKIPPDMIPLAHQVGNIRNHQIHAQHVFLRENAAAVHDDDIVLVFEHIHVLSDFVHTAEGYDPEPTDFVLLCSRAHFCRLSFCAFCTAVQREKGQAHPCPSLPP